MPVYNYKAYDKTGKIVNGVIEAKDKTMVITRLQSSNYFPISIEEQKEKKAKGINLSFLLKGVRQKDILIFTQQLSTLLNAGVPLDRALSIIVELTADPKFKTIIESVEKKC